MKPSILKLQKILRLEAERGYDNRAVMGGLERFMDNWEGEARSDGLSEELTQAVGGRLRDYTRLTPASRFEALSGLLRRMEQAGEGLNVTLPPPGVVEKATPAAPAATRPPETPRYASGASQPAYREHEPAAIYASVTVLPQVGPRHAQTLERLGLRTLRDMLYYQPRRYDDYSRLKPINRLEYGEEVTVLGTVQSAFTRPVRGGRMQLSEAVVHDGSGALRVTWFNQPWVAKRLRPGMQLALSGKVEQYLGRPIMNGPEWEPLDQQQISTQRIVPVYPLTAQITQRWLRRLMSQVVSYWAPRLRDPLPEIVRRSADLMELSAALEQTHFPDNQEKLKAARHRLAFDEIFLLQLGVLRQKRSWQERDAAPYAVSDDWLQAQVESLPYALTGAQQRALADVRADLASGHPMNRLLQGDVGSGKTVIAALAVAMAASQGAQAAVMAPTGILAEQHYQTLRRLLAAPQGGAWHFPPEAVRLLVGATPEAEKREIRAGLEDGSIQLVIGTHALIEDPVTFANLGLVVVDEQHRFGVEQRAALRSKGANPHLLVMTATPIPRSLALTIYGDLDLSVMDEMPPGRQAVSTHVLTPLERERAYRLIQREIEAGRQAFIIYPLVEESENSDGKAAVEEHARLQAEIFPHWRLGLLHGRLKGEEKDEVMERFHRGETHILVSTSVVEVGVDVPNATVMLIEGANRFGLAQLHQFRGRVGRGSEQSYCLLIPDAPDALENERLLVMAQTNDGFVLAEQDLAQRGPGDFLGTRQAGFSELQMANLADVHLIEKARVQAHALFERDPDLQQPAHQYLATSLERFWGGGKGDVS
jgi:ATP-dependent DNA helicase RecG